jgi:hypothetical protein
VKSHTVTRKVVVGVFYLDFRAASAQVQSVSGAVVRRLGAGPPARSSPDDLQVCQFQHRVLAHADLLMLNSCV